jgi:putative peptide zinc metalloprotease protein
MADLAPASTTVPPGALALVLPDGACVPITHSLTIGRGDDADVRLTDLTVSRVHARITEGPGGLLLEDAGSRYGTLLSGERVEQPVRLRPGAVIHVGDVMLKIENAHAQTPHAPGSSARAVAAPVSIPGESLAVVLPDGARVSITRSLTIGRDDEADIRLDDMTVSRVHARITVGPGGPLLEDAGSRYGTRLAGVQVDTAMPLDAGAVIRVGDVSLRVEGAGAAPSGAPESAAGETIVVPVGATQMGLRQPPPRARRGGLDRGLRPRVRSGWALKRLGAEEGDRRFVLRELRTGAFLRMDADDAALFELLDGQRSVTELIAKAEEALGPRGPGRLARLLAELGDRGLLDGVDAAPAVPRAARGFGRLLRPREHTFDWVGDVCERAYRRFGARFFSPLGMTFLVLVALAGFAAFAYLVGARYGTPFVVANRLLLGGAVFVLGRFILVALHELAHGMALAHYKRRVVRGGVRLVLIFPYAFVDTSEAYFEPRSHRIVVSAAGPVSDVSLGALFSFLCAAWPSGAVREVFFQLAFGAYVGAFFNLNPFLDRDGYQILVEFLREPGLRQRARRQFAEQLSGAKAAGSGDSVLARYAAFGLIWSVLAAAFAIGFSTRYYDRLLSLAPHGLVTAIFVVFSALLFLPVLITLALPLWSRMRYGTAEVNRVLD